MSEIRSLGLFVLGVALCAVPCAAAQKKPSPASVPASAAADQVLAIALDDTFKKVNERRVDKDVIVQYGLKNETKDNWTQLITNNSLSEDKNPGEHFLQMEEGARAKSCPDVVTQLLSDPKKSGQVVRGVMYCPKNSESGKGEYSAIVIVKRKAGLSLAIWENRTKPYAKDDIKVMLQGDIGKTIDEEFKHMRTCKLDSHGKASDCIIP